MPPKKQVAKKRKTKPESDSEGRDETLSVDIEEKIAEFLRRGNFITARQTLIIKNKERRNRELSEFAVNHGNGQIGILQCN